MLYRRRGVAFSRLNSPELCFVAHPLEPGGRREGRVPAAPAVRCAKMHTQEEPHSSIQVKPNTRPSLRDGRTAYAVLSREPNSFWPPSPRRKSPAPRRLTRLPHSQGLDRSNDGQDHTVLPYARPAISPQFSRPCRRSRKLAGETKPGSAVRPRDAKGSRRAIRPAPGLSRPTLPRPPQTRLANMTTTRSPLKDEPGWATHTANQNFGKAEYFRGSGLTEGDTAKSCPRGRAQRHPAIASQARMPGCLQRTIGQAIQLHGAYRTTKSTRRFPAGCSSKCFDRSYQLR